MWFERAVVGGGVIFLLYWEGISIGCSVFGNRISPLLGLTSCSSGGHVIWPGWPCTGAGIQHFHLAACRATADGLCVSVSNIGSLMVHRLLQRGQTQHGARGALSTTSILSLLSSPKALSHLLALTIINAVVCGAVLSKKKIVSLHGKTLIYQDKQSSWAAVGTWHTSKPLCGHIRSICAYISFPGERCSLGHISRKGS